eukprot:5584324-Pyramimonas_sp.AAC.1
MNQISVSTWGRSSPYLRRCWSYRLRTTAGSSWGNMGGRSSYSRLAPPSPHIRTRAAYQHSTSASSKGPWCTHTTHTPFGAVLGASANAVSKRDVHGGDVFRIDLDLT